MPIIVTVHSPLSQAWRDPGRRTGHLVPVLAPRAYGHAAGVVAVSEGIAAELRSNPRLARRGIDVVPNPVVSAAFLEAARTVPDHPWLAAPAEDGRVPVVVVVGRLAPEKDLGTFLAAMAAVGTRRRVRAIVVGDGPDRAQLEARARQLGIAADVDFAGERDDAGAFIAAADVVVLTSRFEGMPTVLVEALALGRRVVATDCPTGPRELLDGGRYGRLVPVGDVQAVADAVDAALDDPLPSVPADVLAPYTPTAAADRYLAIVAAAGGASAPAGRAAS